MSKLFLLFALLIVLLSACASPTPTLLPIPAPKITVENVWSRPTPSTAQAGAFYMTIRNTAATADKLTAGSSVGCGTVELHESYQMANGVMGMRMVTGGFIVLPANSVVEFKEGGLHIMCINKKMAFNKGIKIPLTLVFEKAGEVKIEVEVRDQTGI